MYKGATDQLRSFPHDYEAQRALFAFSFACFRVLISLVFDGQQDRSGFLHEVHRHIFGMGVPGHVCHRPARPGVAKPLVPLRRFLCVSPP